MGVYPPSESTMANHCTRNICGVSNRTLYDMVTQELLDYLNQPGLTTEKLFNDFGDAKGSFYKHFHGSPSPDLAGRSDGVWLNFAFAPGWRNMEAATALVNSSPSSAQEVMQVPKIGPDHYYDMFCKTLWRMIKGRGVCLPIFRWTLGDNGPIFVNNQYFVMTKRSTGEKFFVTTKDGIPYALDDDTIFFALPTTGVYTIQLAIPKYDFYDPFQVYQASELIAGPLFRKTVDITPETNCLAVDVKTGILTIHGWKDKKVKFAIVRQKDSYSAHKGSPLYNKRGEKCNGDTPCEKFAFRKQEEIENTPLRTITKPAGRYGMTLYDIPYNFSEGKLYKVLVYSDDDIVVATGRHIEFSSSQPDNVISFPHARAIYVDPDILPRCAFLQGDIIRQYQKETPNCGTFSLALAASYWEPLKYNPLKRSGKWMEDEHGDWPPWTGQGTMNDVTEKLGFSGSGKTLDGDTTPNKGLRILKRLISEGIPVIVNIDEYQDTTTTTGEHYKVLVGYDDAAVLHYTKNNGDVGSTYGALYFANSGAKGLDEGNPNKFVDKIANSRRENHDDYDNVPIGNDVDSYRAFWHKWKHGGFNPVTDDLWYLAFKPRS